MNAFGPTKMWIKGHVRNSSYVTLLHNKTWDDVRDKQKKKTARTSMPESRMTIFILIFLEATLPCITTHAWQIGLEGNASGSIYSNCSRN